MKAAVDRSKKKETNDPSLDLLYKIPVNKTFQSLHFYHVLQGLTPQWCVRPVSYTHLTLPTTT